MLFVTRKLRQLGDLAGTVVASLGAIAAGRVGQAAAAIERSLAQTVPLVLGFFARWLGLGDVGRAIRGILETRIRKPLDALVDRLIDRLVRWIRPAGKAARSMQQRAVAWWRRRWAFKTTSGEAHTLYFRGRGRRARLRIIRCDLPVGANFPICR